MRLLWSACGGLLLGAVAPLSAQQSYGFITRLGRDTISIETVTRTADRLIGDGVQRYPRVVIRHYEAQLASDGMIRHISIDNRYASRGGPDLPQRVDIAFGADSVCMTVEHFGRVTERSAVATNGMLAMPVIEALYGPYEQLLVAARNRRLDSVPLTFVSADPLPPNANPSFVKRLTGDSVILSWLGFPFIATVTHDGRMTAFSGDRTTRKVHVERLVAVPDLPPIAARFAASEAASGGAASALSVRDTARGSIGGAELLVDYGRPLTRGRVILGGIVPFDSVWRTGANDATQFRTSVPITLAGIPLDAGTYTLWTRPTRDGATLIVNRQIGQWGTQYDSARDVRRATLHAAVLPATTERFTIRIESSGAASGRLVIEWARFRWSAAITLP